MRTKAFCLTLMLMLTAFCAFAPRVYANDGDWTPDTKPQWWWKYVYPGGIHPNWADVTNIDIVQIRSDRAGFNAFQVTFTMMNKTSTAYKGGNSFQMEHAFCDPDDPQPWRPGVISRGTLPAMKAGQAIRLTGIAYSSQKVKTQNYVSLSVGQ